MKDERPEPKPRKHPQLWQAYCAWTELVDVRKRHTLRLSAIERGKSNYDAEWERRWLEDTRIDTLIANTLKEMATWGEMTGAIWPWLNDIKGIGPSLAAQLLAQIDDVGKFDTISKLWRFAGWAVIDGQAERNQRGEKSHYNAKLKSVCWLCIDSFIKQQTPGYIDIYYAEKERQRDLHPEKIKVNGKCQFNDGHIDNRARRKVAKIFLQHVWIKWREFEGLPISKPWVIDVAGHTNYVEPGTV